MWLTKAHTSQEAPTSTSGSSSLAPTLEDAIKLAKENATAKKPISIGVVGNAADIYEKVLASDFRPDICSEMCPCHDPIPYLPSGYTAEEADELRIMIEINIYILLEKL